MKKLGLGFIAVLAVGAIYYLTLGSTQITEQIKTEVNSEIKQLQSSGFKIEKQDHSETKETLMITVDEPQKVQQYLLAKGEQVSLADVKQLQGVRLKMELSYLPTLKDALAMDIYLDTLPTNFRKDLGIDQNNSTFQSINKMLKEGKIMVHINVNKLRSGFDGYLKDIDQTFKEEQETHFLLKGLTFHGKMDEKKITDFSQKLETLVLEVGHELKMTFSHLTTEVKKNQKERDIAYKIKTIDLNINTDKKLDLQFKELVGESTDIQRGELLDNQSHFKIASVVLNEAGKESQLQQIQIDSDTKNVDIKALEALQAYSEEKASNPEPFKAFVPILKAFTLSGLSMDISKLSIGSITTEGKTFDGIHLSSQLQLNKDFKWKGVEANPMLLMKLPQVKANIALSNEVFNLMAQTPQAMMIMLMAHPVDKNGTKVYDIEFNQGSLTLNGKPFM